MDTIRFFKDRAKQLSKSLPEDAQARSRVAAVLQQKTNVTLQNVQHVVAVEAGFEHWKALLDAPEDERLLVIAMTNEPQLNKFGVGVFDGHRSKPKAERCAILEAERKELRGSVDEVTWIAQWLKSNIAPTKTINRHHSSYGLKHIAEKYSPKQYLANGAFIAGAIVAGFPYRFLPDSPNAMFGMSEKSIKALLKRPHATTYRCQLCGFLYTDHGPMDPTGYHRRMMAAFRVSTWEEAEPLVRQGARAVSNDPSWVGQVCDDRSGQPRGVSCYGRLVLSAGAQPDAAGTRHGGAGDRFC